MLDYLLTGGAARQRVADLAHALIWARRLQRGCYDSHEMIPEIQLFNQIDLTNRVALDVGAHAGSWTRVLARRVGSGGMVVAYEGFPHYGRALSLAMRLLGERNVRVRQVAVGAHEGDVALRWRSEGGEFLSGQAHINTDGADSANAVKVQMVSIDYDLKRLGIHPKDVGFVKIDVEGAELEVLRGASNLLSVGSPPVFLEAEPQWVSGMGHSVQDLFSEMAGFRYKAYFVSPNGVEPTTIEEYLARYRYHFTKGPIPVFYNNILFLPAGST